MNKNFELLITIANGFKESWNMDFPDGYEAINEMEQTELATKFPNLFDAIIGIMEFAESDDVSDL